MDHQELLNLLIEAIDYSFLKTDGSYNKDLSMPVIDKVKYIKERAVRERAYKKNKEYCSLCMDINCDGCGVKKDIDEYEKNCEEEQRDKELDEAVVNYMSQFTGVNYYKSPWAIDSTGMAMPRDLAKFGAKWQWKKDKKWLTDNHKKIFNSGYDEGFEAGREDMDDEMMGKAIDAEVESAGRFAPIIRVEDKSKVADLKFGDKVKIIIVKEE